MVFDPSYPKINIEDFPKRSWKQYYGKVEEEIPSGCPQPLGKEFLIRAYVDANFAGDRITRRSRTGFVVMINNAPVFWY